MKSYSILELADELDTNKSKIRRSIDRLELEALNEHTRTKNNEPKLYDITAKDLIMADIDPQNAQRRTVYTDATHSDTPKHTETADKSKENTKNAQRTTQTDTHAERNATRDNDIELIKLLKEQLEQANLDKATLSRHLDQAQLLHLNTQKENEKLKLELKGNTEVDETKGSDEPQEEKRTIFSIFKRKK